MAAQAVAAGALQDAQLGGVAQAFGQREREGRVGRSGHRQVDVDLGIGARGAGFVQQHEAVQAHAEAHRRHAAPAKAFHQAVVAPAGADGVLGAKGIGDPLEDAVGVVILAAHEQWIDAVAHTGLVEAAAQLVEVLAGCVVQALQRLGGIGDDGSGSCHFAVENTQGVGVQTAPAVGIQRVFVRRQVVQQQFAVALAGRASAQGVHFQGERVFKAKLVKHPRQHGQHLRVHVRPGHAQRLGADLRVLAAAAFLRALVAEHRAVVPELLLAVVQQAVLDAGANAAGRSLRTQGQGFALAVREGVHLLLHQVRCFAEAAAEELGRLDERQADFPVAVAAKHICDDGFHMPPAGAGIGQDVAHSAHELVAPGHGRCLSKTKRYGPTTRRATVCRVCGGNATGSPLKATRTPGA